MPKNNHIIVMSCINISTYLSKRIIIIGPNENPKFPKAAIVTEHYPLLSLTVSFVWMISYFLKLFIIHYEFHFEQDIKSIMTQQIPCIVKMVLDELGSTHLAEDIQELVHTILSNLIQKGRQLADSKFLRYQIVLLLKLITFFDHCTLNINFKDVVTCVLFQSKYDDYNLSIISPNDRRKMGRRKSPPNLSRNLLSLSWLQKLLNLIAQKGKILVNFSCHPKKS